MRQLTLITSLTLALASPLAAADAASNTTPVSVAGAPSIATPLAATALAPFVTSTPAPPRGILGIRSRRAERTVRALGRALGYMVQQKFNEDR